MDGLRKMLRFKRKSDEPNESDTKNNSTKPDDFDEINSPMQIDMNKVAIKLKEIASQLSKSAASRGATKN